MSYNVQCYYCYFFMIQAMVKEKNRNKKLNYILTIKNIYLLYKIQNIIHSDLSIVKQKIIINAQTLTLKNK